MIYVQKNINKDHILYNEKKDKLTSKSKMHSFQIAWPHWLDIIILMKHIAYTQKNHSMYTVDVHSIIRLFHK